MNFSLENLTYNPGLSPVRFAVTEPSLSACDSFGRAILLIAVLQFLFSLLLLFYFGPRGRLRRLVRTEAQAAFIGALLLGLNAGLAALLLENLYRVVT